MGNVWAARLKGARGFRKLFAVKTISHVVNDSRLEQMLFEEATLASQIQHPNVVETIELGEHEGKLYLVMDLVDGESLSFILRKAVPEGGVPLAAAVNLLGQVLHGLQAAHDLTDEHGERVGLVHRDISPPNVLVTYTGTVKIVDFGVAITSSSRASDPNEVKGKVSYFAPEQLRAQVLDARVDVFAAGILLYLLTTNRHPFRASAEADTINRILSGAPVTPPSAFVEDYPEALESVVLRALEKERDRRYLSAAAFLEALERAMPSAFGPAGDKLLADYVHTLLKDRISERRSVLRAAEDWAETSSPHASSAPFASEASIPRASESSIPRASESSIARASESLMLCASEPSMPCASESSMPCASESSMPCAPESSIPQASESSSRTSVLSVPVMVTTRLTPMRVSRGGPLALAALCLTLVGSAATLHSFASGSSPAALPAQARAEAKPPRPAQVAAALPHATLPSQPVSPVVAAEVAVKAAAVQVAAVQVAAVEGNPASLVRSPPSRRSDRLESPDAARLPGAALSALPKADPKPGEGLAAFAVGSGLGAVDDSGVEAVTSQLLPAAAARLAPVPTGPSKSAPAKVRLLGSRLGHGRLAIDPLSEPYRPRLPLALQRTDQRFVATVNICVSAGGGVSGVKFVRSAGPMIDAQLANAVSRWRYRPLVDAGEVVPFCYVLRYEFAGR